MTYQSSLEARALEALVDAMMDGKKYPAVRHGYSQQISLLDILRETDAGELASIMDEFNGTKDADAYQSALRELVADYLRDTHWHVEVAETMDEDARAEAAEQRAEINKEIRYD